MRPIPLDVSMPCQLRLLEADDSQRLGDYFAGLGAETRRRFAPHPLTHEHAIMLCQQAHDTAQRFILELDDDSIIGYFILDYAMGEEEAGRYHSLGVELQSDLDPLFAPSIADAYQNQGLASATMPHLIAEALKKGARSLVLLGGVQDTNARAKAFYSHFGFKPHSGYQTDVWNVDMRLEFTL